MILKYTFNLSNMWTIVRFSKGVNSDPNLLSIYISKYMCLQKPETVRTSALSSFKEEFHIDIYFYYNSSFENRLLYILIFTQVASVYMFFNCVNITFTLIKDSKEEGR